MSRWIVRGPGLADADAVAEVHWRSWRETYAGLVPESRLGQAALERRRQQWRQRLAEPDPADVVRVGVADGVVVGWALAGPARPDSGPAASGGGELPAADWELWGLYVLEEQHGTGLGQALLEATVPPGPAYCWVARDNPRARAFYRRNGFVEDGAAVVEEHLGDLVTVRMVRT